MKVVPVFNPSNAAHLRYLLVSFPNSADAWVHDDELRHLGEYVAGIANQVGNEICTTAETEARSACARSHTQGEFFTNLVTLINKRTDCQGMSIWLQNDIRTELRLAAQPQGTRMQWNPALKEYERFYRKGDGSLTSWCWERGEMLLFSDANKAREGRKTKSSEKSVDSKRSECIFAPMARL